MVGGTEGGLWDSSLPSTPVFLFKLNVSACWHEFACVCVCVCVCVCTCPYLYLDASVCVHLCIQAREHACVHASMCVHMCLCLWVCWAGVTVCELQPGKVKEQKM